jgi:(p)ppGpp synthase/HD superfamily hydrolase
MYFLDTIEKERTRRAKELESPNQNFSLLIDDFSKVCNENEVKEITEFYHLLLSFEYSHPGLNKFAYMAHPIRVARLYISYCNNFSLDAFKLALAHNVIELTGMSDEDILPNTLKPIFHMIQKLTVDRSKQWDIDYKENYYEIISCSEEMSVVKILDKLDNLYGLSSNPSKEIKLLYLHEIEKFVLPLASTFTPKLVDIMDNLIIFNQQEIDGGSNEI